MASIRFTDVQVRPTEFLDLTSLTLDEFQQLIPPFEAAFQAHMAAWRLDGKPRTARRFSVYQNCPLPTPEDRLLFILVYLKTYALQVVQGRLILIEAPSSAYHRGMLSLDNNHSHEEETSCASTPSNTHFTAASICMPAPCTSVS